MAKTGRSDSLSRLFARGDRAGAKFLVDANLSRDPSSLHRRWEQATVYCWVGLVESGLAAALTLRDTEAWPEVSPEVWDFTLWAGRPDLGLSLVEEWIDVIESREDINALPWSWQRVARTYLGLAWAAGDAPRAETRLAGHAQLSDSGWSLGSDTEVSVTGSAKFMVESFLPPTVAAVQGRFVSCGEFDEEYDQLLAALFSLAQMSPQAAWTKLDELEATRSLHPLGAAYRAQVARRGGDLASSQRWLHAWFAEPLFPMSVADLVVTGLLGFFVEVRPQWAVTR